MFVAYGQIWISAVYQTILCRKSNDTQAFILQQSPHRDTLCLLSHYRKAWVVGSHYQAYTADSKSALKLLVILVLINTNSLILSWINWRNGEGMGKYNVLRKTLPEWSVIEKPILFGYEIPRVLTATSICHTNFLGICALVLLISGKLESLWWTWWSQKLRRLTNFFHKFCKS